VLEPGGISRSNIAGDCEKMLEVIQRHRHLLGWLSYLSWRAYVLYRWAAMEQEPRAALFQIWRSFLNWPAPLTGKPTMQAWGRLRRFVVLVRQIARVRQRPSAMRASL
jgi:hypothetical protein